jgi:HAD superfamily hydrolase (TIGR01509 family)
MNKLLFDLVIFDCDGVLVESEPLACQVYIQLFAEYGYGLDYAETLQKFHGTTLTERVETTSRELGITPPEDFISVFNARLSALTEHALQPVPYIHNFIESLTVPICVASNGTRDEINLRLKVTGLTHYFGKSIFSGMEVPSPKPAPDVYLAAAQSFNINPTRCIVIEDSVLGVTAAVTAGMQVYGYTAFNSAEALQAAGAIPFSSMLEMKETLAGECSPV